MPIAASGDRSRIIGYASHENLSQDLMMILTNAGSHIFTAVGSLTSVSHVA